MSSAPDREAWAIECIIKDALFSPGRAYPPSRSSATAAAISSWVGCAHLAAWLAWRDVMPEIAATARRASFASGDWSIASYMRSSVLRGWRPRIEAGRAESAIDGQHGEGESCQLGPWENPGRIPSARLPSETGPDRLIPAAPSR